MSAYLALWPANKGTIYFHYFTTCVSTCRGLAIIWFVAGRKLSSPDNMRMEVTCCSWLLSISSQSPFCTDSLQIALKDTFKISVTSCAWQILSRPAVENIHFPPSKQYKVHPFITALKKVTCCPKFTLPIFKFLTIICALSLSMNLPEMRKSTLCSFCSLLFSEGVC